MRSETVEVSGGRAGWQRLMLSLVFSICLFALPESSPPAYGAPDDPPTPLLAKGKPVDWWFVFKFNSASFPGCAAKVERQCRFGGKVRDYKFYGQQYVYASSAAKTLQFGSGCAGDTESDPVGATFDQVYNGPYFYVIWNDQFYADPKIEGCTESCSSPWGHSKGMLAWNATGEGFILQVSTPSWPAAGSSKFPRATDGNTLGCVEDDNVEVSQHFFALKLAKADVIDVLKGLENASVVTDPKNPQIVNNGGPDDIQRLVIGLGKKSGNSAHNRVRLSHGVELISKPSHLNVPPWQMVSAVLGGVSLRTATWWANPKIFTTTPSTPIECWSGVLGSPGTVEIALSGEWDGTEFGLAGASGPDFNHAKIGVSISGDHHYSIFGDLNQQGTLSGPKCSRSQNGRGGLFFVIDDPVLSKSVKGLIAGDTAPTQP